MKTEKNIWSKTAPDTKLLLLVLVIAVGSFAAGFTAGWLWL